MKERIFGLDIGTTSIGFAVIDHDPDQRTGSIHRLGVRIFPEARDPDGTPLNQERRTKRMMRRQLRRRRQRRRALNEALYTAGLLPRFEKDKGSEWACVMAVDPYELRRRGIEEPLTAFELGRALYHLAKRRHFKGRDLAETEAGDEAPDDKEAKTNRDTTLAALRREGVTFGAWLAAKKADATRGHPPTERRRGVHANRETIAAEFERLWTTQSPHHPILRDRSFREAVWEIIFFQRPVFWRTNTLGSCRFMPGAPLCPKGSWLSQQRRMLEKLNNLALSGNSQRPLDAEERSAILTKLQAQGAMSWTGVRAALRPLYAARGEKGAEKGLKFNLELGGDKGLLGNPLEAKLAKIFSDSWINHPQKQAIRDRVYDQLGVADYDRTPDGKRVIILPESERQQRRAIATKTFITDFGISQEQAAAIEDLIIPTGWEPFSTAAISAFLPKLEEGVRMGDLLNGPAYEAWRDTTFPRRERPTGEVLDLLPSPKNKDEQERIAKLRNPTVVRVQNELRKVVNNLIRVYGKPDRIRVELTRDVGKSKREREDDQKRNRKNERARKAAQADLESKGIVQPSRDDIEKWLLWQECGEFDPYSGRSISFDELFRKNIFQVEHIWPRSKSLDDGFGNKTLCHRDWNMHKNNRTPFEAFGHTAEWPIMKGRIWKYVAEKRMSKGKALRFSHEEPLPNDFASRQLNDTGYAARQAVTFLKRLWPDAGPEAPVTVQTVSGRVTAQLRRLWHLNNILSDTGEKTRSDHRHHAVDALAVACAHPGVTQMLSRYWQGKDDRSTQHPHLPPPWPTIRVNSEKSVTEIIVSHKVRRKLSGALHDQMPLGYANQTVTKNGVTLGIYVKTMAVEKLPPATLEINSVEEISRTAKFVVRDGIVRNILREHLRERGDKPDKAYPPYPRIGSYGPEIRKVRVLTTQQMNLMVPVANGYADPGNNHHIAIYRKPDGNCAFDVVTLYVACRRLAHHEPVVQRDRQDGSTFVMSLAQGDAVEFPNGEGVWITQGVWSNGQIVLEHSNDASHLTTTRPNPGALLRKGGRKVAVDPIGRVSPAHD